jgi:hypothetical protein
LLRQIINELDPPVNNKELAITIDNPPITLNYDYNDLNNDIDPEFEDIYTGFCPIEINVPIPNFIKKWEDLPMVDYETEDPTTHETITATTFTLYDQPVNTNGKFKIVKWNNIPDNPFYDGLLGEGLILRKITETEETTDRDWDVQINIQPPLYNLDLGELSVNTGRVITILPTDYDDDSVNYYGFGSVSYSVNVKYGTLDLGILRSNNDNEITILPVSYNWQYFDAVKYQVQVAQPITTNNFTNPDQNTTYTLRSLYQGNDDPIGFTPDSSITIAVPQPITTSNFTNPSQNITYTLSELYQGNDNPVGFTPDSTITIAVPPTLYYHAPLNIGELTGNTSQTVTITPQSRGLDYFDDVSYSINVPQPITATFTTIVRNNEDYTLSQLYNGQDPVGFTPSSTFRVQINPNLLSNVTLNITSNNSTTTLQQLLLDNNIDPTNWNGLDKTCEIHVQVPQITNPLETLTNKRLQSETTYTISSLMSDPTNNAGITKNSTIIVDVPDPIYPTVTFNTITNNNSTYTLSRLTNNLSEYFSKDSTITTNINTKRQISKNNFYLNTSNITTWYNGAIPITPTTGYNQIQFTKLPATGTNNWSEWHFYIILGYNESGRLFLMFYQPSANHNNVNYFRNCYYHDASSTGNQMNWVRIKYNNNNYVIGGQRDNVAPADLGGRDNISMIFLDDWEITDF